MILPGGVSAKALHEMSPDERAQVFAEAKDRVQQVLDDKVADLKRPMSFKGCGPWQEKVMTVVQHAAGPNSITVSHDGIIKGAWRLPLAHTKAPKAGKPIVRILHTVVAFQPMPLELGFLLIGVPGWLASERELCQAQLPQLSSEIEWTEAQLAAWKKLRKEFAAGQQAAEREEGRKRKQQRYNDGRAADGSRNGYFTISDIAFGRARL